MPSGNGKRPYLYLGKGKIHPIGKEIKYAHPGLFAALKRQTNNLGRLPKPLTITPAKRLLSMQT